LHGQRWQDAAAVFVVGPTFGNGEVLCFLAFGLEAGADEVVVVPTFIREEVVRGLVI
jgi:hypothetical protein